MSEENQVAVVETQEQAAPAPKLTAAEKLAKRIAFLTQRIASDKEELEELARESDAQATVAQIAAGYTVVAVLGRAETKREVRGVIVGVKVEEDGDRKFKVAYGEGFDADFVVVRVSQLKEITAPA